MSLTNDKNNSTPLDENEVRNQQTTTRLTPTTLTNTDNTQIVKTLTL